MGSITTVSWHFWLIFVVAWRCAQNTPQFLACGNDGNTRLRPGDTIMGVAVGALSSGNIISPSILRHGDIVTHFTPGETLTVHLEGLPGEALFVMRVNDGGGQLAGASGARPVTSKCQSQVYAADPSTGQTPADVLLTTPCYDCPATITVAVVAATNPAGPMHYSNISVKRGKGRDSQCPPKSPPATPPYPFNLPINDTCPNGAAAQHRAPCPKVACVYPVGKEGTCVTSSDGSVPDRNGSLDTEARVDLLTHDITPISHHFTTGAAADDLTPRAWSRNMSGWTLRVDGEVEKARDFTMGDLKQFPHVKRQYVIECSGNWGRGMVPAAAQADFWNIGAVGCAEWTGVLLRDVLHAVGVTHKGVFVAYFGEDNFRSRGIPILKALDGHTMLAWSMNGEPLPAFHGFPLRLVAPGYPGSAHGKWLKRLWVRDRVHDGLGMMGKSYKLPKFPLRPGSYNASDSDFKIFTQQPVRSLIVRPPRCTVTSNLTIWLEGKAWSGAGDVNRVELSYDFGVSWHPTALSRPANKWAWQRWDATLKLPSPGVWFIYARATDHIGAVQPMLVPGWNPGGYANNQAMMVDIEVTPTPLEVTPISSSPQTQRLEEVCTICGHEYNPLTDCGGRSNPHMDCGKGVAFDSLPESWRCPVCGVLKKNYHLFHTLPTPTPAPGTLPQNGEWHCPVCDHVYDPLKDCGGMDGLGNDCGKGVPFESLPDSWRCPLCGADKAHYHMSHPKQVIDPKQVIAITGIMDAIGDFIAQFGSYVSVSLVSSATVLALYGLVTKKFLLVSLVSAAVVKGGMDAFNGMPPLVVGHAVGMLTCWSLMTIGATLRRSMLSSSGLPQIEQTRLPHAILQSCALFIAIVGVACIFWNHALMGASQFGLDSGTPLANTLHAMMGWCVVALMLLQGSQGWSKYLLMKIGKISYSKHSQLGKAVLLLSSGNIVIILWSFRAQVGNLQALIVSSAVVFASILACMISGPRPALARAHEDAVDSHFEALLK